MASIALIDGDIIAYRCAASCEPNKEKLEREPLEFAIARCDDLFHRIMQTTGCTEYQCYLSGADNFRYLINPEYKAHRKTKPTPLYLNDLREHLIVKWKSTLALGYEADDAIGMAAVGDYIVVSVDKDLFQIPGTHYNFVKNEFYQQTVDAAMRVLPRQLLEGDRADGIEGIWRVGPKRAGDVLDSYPDLVELYQYIRQLYADDVRFEDNLRLLRILRNENEYEEVLKYIETTKRQSKREDSAKDSSQEDFSPFSTVNS